MSFKVICGIIHSKTCQLLKEIVLYILNTPGKLLEKAQKVLENPGFLPWISLIMKVYEPCQIANGIALKFLRNHFAFWCLIQTKIKKIMNFFTCTQVYLYLYLDLLLSTTTSVK